MTKGTKLYLARKKIGYTRVEVQEKTGISDKLLFKYEKDIVTNIPLDKLETLCNLYNIAPAYLMGWDEEIKPATVNKNLLVFDQQEQFLIELFRLMDDENKQNLLTVAKTFANVTTKKPIYSTTATLITEDSSLK